VPNGARFIGEEFPIYINFAMYPNPNELPKGGELELFLFNPIVQRTSENEFRMKRQDGIEAYFLKFSKNGKRYYAVSKDEIITIQNEIILYNIEQILDLILIDDIIFYDEAGTYNYHGSELYWGGYIVKTKTDNNYLWLNAAFPFY
jgi:hypothetical protein